MRFMSIADMAYPFSGVGIDWTDFDFGRMTLMVVGIEMACQLVVI